MNATYSTRFTLIQDLQKKPTQLTGQQILLNKDKSHHLQNVLRLDWSSPVRVTDGKGRVWMASLENISGQAHLVMGELLREDSSPRGRRLFIGLPKNSTMDWVVEKAVECGATEIIPVQTSRSVVKLDTKDPSKHLKRWEAIAEGALEQCERSHVTKIHTPMVWSELSSFCASKTSELRLGFFSEERSPLDQKVFQNCAGRDVSLFIGPEGGFSVDEKMDLTSLGFSATSLGETVLRVETAVISSLTLVGFHQL